MVSNDCIGGINPCGLFRDCIYCFQSHLSLLVGMVNIRRFLFLHIYEQHYFIFVWCMCLF